VCVFFCVPFSFLMPLSSSSFFCKAILMHGCTPFLPVCPQDCFAFSHHCNAASLAPAASHFSLRHRFQIRSLFSASLSFKPLPQTPPIIMSLPHDLFQKTFYVCGRLPFHGRDSFGSFPSCMSPFPFWELLSLKRQLVGTENSFSVCLLFPGIALPTFFINTFFRSVSKRDVDRPPLLYFYSTSPLMQTENNLLLPFALPNFFFHQLSLLRDCFPKQNVSQESTLRFPS